MPRLLGFFGPPCKPWGTACAVAFVAGCALFEPSPDEVYVLTSIRGLPLPVTIDMGATPEGEIEELQVVSAKYELFFPTRKLRATVTTQQVVLGEVVSVSTNVSRYGTFRFSGDSLHIEFQNPDLHVVNISFGIHDGGQRLHASGAFRYSNRIYERQ